jgi:cytoskeletal protein CcmA (bactofilin family)
MHRLTVIPIALLVVLTNMACAARREEAGFARDVGTDHFAAGRSVEIDRPVAGDAIAAGEEVLVTSKVGGDAILAGRHVLIDGDVGGNVYAAGSQVVVNAEVGRNARVAGARVDIGRQAQIAGNASLAGGHVNVAGGVKGYLLAAGNRIYIDGTIGGDVEASGREVVLGPNARVTGALRYRSPHALEQDPHAVVSGGVERLAVHTPVAPARTAHRFGRWIWTVGLMILAASLVAALPGFYTRVSARVPQHFLLNMLLAFVVIVCVPVAILLLLITGIGAPLGLLTALAYPGLLLVGYVSAGIALGDAILRRGKPAHFSATRWRAAFAALGMLIIALIVRIPWVGGFIALVVLLVGLGAFAFQVWATARAGRAMSAP